MASAFCACRDCPEIGSPEDSRFPTLCNECEEAGCMPPEGMSGYSRECQRDDAYMS